MKQTTALTEQDKSQTGKTEVSQTQPIVGRFAEIPYDQFTPEQQEACRSLIYAHETFAKDSGMPPEMIDAVISGLPASFANEREQVIYEMATALANSRWISKGLYDRAVKALGHIGITDVTVLMGFYTAVSLTVGFYDVPAPQG